MPTLTLNHGVVTKHLVSLILFAVVLAACAGDTEVVPMAEGAGGSSALGVSVTGVGEVLGAPDTMTLTIGVQVTRATVAEASDVAASRATAVIEALREAGVADDDIQTANFSIYPEYDYGPRERRLIGFTVANSVAAKIRSIDTAGDTIDAAVAAGGDETVVQGIGFAVEDDSERLEAARSRAWTDAEDKARQLADLAGVELGDAIRISEGVQSSPFDVRVSAGADFEEAVSTPIEAGQVVSTVHLSVVFAISN